MTTPPRAPLRFVFDFLSPFAYLAWTQIDEIARVYDRPLVLEPVLFGAMLDAFGTIGPAEVPAKREQTYLDVHRRAALLGVSFVLPPRHPFVPLPALRAATSYAEPGERARAVAALFTAAWGRGEAIDTPESVAAALDVAGLDGRAAIAASATHEVKSALHRATSEAIARGVFGVPTCEVDGERFWGADALPSLRAYLRGEDPLTPEIRRRAREIPIGIERKRRPG